MFREREVSQKSCLVTKLNQWDFIFISELIYMHIYLHYFICTEYKQHFAENNSCYNNSDAERKCKKLNDLLIFMLFVDDGGKINIYIRVSDEKVFLWLFLSVKIIIIYLSLELFNFTSYNHWMILLYSFVCSIKKVSKFCDEKSWRFFTIVEWKYGKKMYTLIGWVCSLLHISCLALIEELGPLYLFKSCYIMHIFMLNIVIVACYCYDFLDIYHDTVKIVCSITK